MTDHRAQAERYGVIADREWNGGETFEATLLPTALGILHALLALTEQPARIPYATPKSQQHDDPHGVEQPNGGSARVWTYPTIPDPDLDGPDAPGKPQEARTATNPHQGHPQQHGTIHPPLSVSEG